MLDVWRINRDIQYQGWQLHFFFVFDSYSIAHISNYLQLLKADEHIIERAEKSMRDNKPNTAFTFCSRTKREAIIAIGRTTNGAEFINSFSHELRHVADKTS